MKKILFACDLDNTLIRSHKKRKDDDICVEHYNGREQSFMSPYAVRLFKHLLENENIFFLPVTTRSIEQYKRINLPDKQKIKHALVSNGGILLEHDNVNQIWKAENDNKIKPYKDEFLNVYEMFKDYKNITSTRIVDERFVFWAFENAEQAADFRDAVGGKTGLKVELQGRKVYALPEFLTKGRSVAEYMKKYDFSYLVSAGDSGVDLSMLETADTAIVPKGYVLSSDNRIFVNDRQDFAEFLLEKCINDIF